MKNGSRIQVKNIDNNDFSFATFVEFRNVKLLTGPFSEDSVQAVVVGDDGALFLANLEDIRVVIKDLAKDVLGDIVEQQIDSQGMDPLTNELMQRAVAAIQK